MEDYIRGLVNSALGNLRSLINGVSSRVLTVWNTVINFFRKVGAAETTLRNRVTNWVLAQIRHAQAIATTLRWLALTFIPRKISQAITAVRTWTSSLIADARNLATSLVNDLRKAVNAAVAELHKLWSDFTSWTRDQVNKLVTLTNQMAKLVFGVLSTPERLAGWIVAPMFGALMKYALAHADSIAAYVWSKRKNAFLIGTDLLEHILMKLL